MFPAAAVNAIDAEFASHNPVGSAGDHVAHQTAEGGEVHLTRGGEGSGQRDGQGMRIVPRMGSPRAASHRRAVRRQRRRWPRRPAASMKRSSAKMV